MKIPRARPVLTLMKLKDQRNRKAIWGKGIFISVYKDGHKTLQTITKTCENMHTCANFFRMLEEPFSRKHSKSAYEVWEHFHRWWKCLSLLCTSAIPHLFNNVFKQTDSCVTCLCNNCSRCCKKNMVNWSNFTSNKSWRLSRNDHHYWNVLYTKQPYPSVKEMREFFTPSFPLLKYKIIFVWTGILESQEMLYICLLILALAYGCPITCINEKPILEDSSGHDAPLNAVLGNRPIPISCQ